MASRSQKMPFPVTTQSSGHTAPALPALRQFPARLKPEHIPQQHRSLNRQGAAFVANLEYEYFFVTSNLRVAHPRHRSLPFHSQGHEPKPAWGSLAPAMTAMRG